MLPVCRIPLDSFVFVGKHSKTSWSPLARGQGRRLMGDEGRGERRRPGPASEPRRAPGARRGQHGRLPPAAEVGTAQAALTSCPEAAGTSNSFFVKISGT